MNQIFYKVILAYSKINQRPFVKSCLCAFALLE